MRFSLVTFDDEAVVFDAASGDTHYLPPLSLALLRLMQADPALDPVALRERLSASYDIDPAMALDSSIQDALGRLRATGILPDT